MLEWLLNLADLTVKCDMILTRARARCFRLSGNCCSVASRARARCFRSPPGGAEMPGARGGCVVAIQEGRGAGRARGTVLTLWRD